MKNRFQIRSALAAVAVFALAACGGASGSDQAEGAESTDGTRAAVGAGALLQQQEASGGSSVIQGGGDGLLGQPQEPPGDSINVDELGFDRGDPDAVVRILEFSDFGCGYCRNFHMETLPALKEEYIEQGTLLWKQVPFVMGNWANSVPASLGAECAMAQDRFDEMSHGLYERQADWKNVSKDEGEAAVRSIAAEAGVDMAAFEACMASDEHLWRVQAHTQLARAVGVRSTPTFFVIGYQPIQGALPLDLFRRVIDTVLVTEAQNADAAPGG